MTDQQRRVVPSGDIGSISDRTSTTADPPRGLLLRVFREGDGICVTDTTGLRYGWGPTLREAVIMWADCVLDVCDEPNAGGSLAAEQRAYRLALGVSS